MRIRIEKLKIIIRLELSFAYKTTFSRIWLEIFEKWYFKTLVFVINRTEQGVSKKKCCWQNAQLSIVLELVNFEKENTRKTAMFQLLHYFPGHSVSF